MESSRAAGNDSKEQRPAFPAAPSGNAGTATAEERSLVESATPERFARTLAEAKEQAKAFVGKTLENASTRMTAIVSGNNLAKMLSESAAKKSSSPEDHALAVANLDRLFANAVEGWSKRRDSDPSDLLTVHRMFAVLDTGQRARLVKLTVKELAQQGNRIYSVESLEVGEVSPVPEMVDADRTEGSRLLTGPTGLAESMAEAVREFNRKPQNGSVAQSPRREAGEAEAPPAATKPKQSQPSPEDKARDFSAAGRGVLEQINALRHFTLE
jgi:hypothetical protein